MVIDVVGYSRLMAADEARTHARVNALFASVVQPAIETHIGRRIERAGDGLIVLFESSTDAVRCALSIQRSAQAAEQSTSLAQRLHLRIGINVGDIIIDGEEIAGDDVNIAARLQSLAEPGTVCISAAVRSQLHEELDNTFEDLGEVRLKNIGRPVRVFQLRDRDTSGATARLAVSKLYRYALRQWRSVAAIVALAAICIAWMIVSRPLSATYAAMPMSVAVQSFSAASGVDASLPHELALDIRRGLTATGWLKVGAANKDENILGRAEGFSAGLTGATRYVVHGRLSVAGELLQADVNLLDVTKNLDIWTTRVTNGMRSTGAEDLSMSIVVKLREAIYEAETQRLIERGGRAESAIEHKMLGDTLRVRYPALDEELAARPYYEKSLALDPDFVPSLVSLAYTLLWESDLDTHANTAALIERAEQISRRAVVQSPEGAPAWQLRAEVLARKGQWAAALAASDKSLSFDARRAIAFGQRGSLLVRLGRPAEALIAIDRALAMTEQGFGGYTYFQQCRALMALGDYRAAKNACELSVAREDWWMPRAYVASAHAWEEGREKAAPELRELLRQRPGLSIERVLAAERSGVEAFDIALEKHLLQGLRMAGLKERD